MANKQMQLKVVRSVKSITLRKSRAIPASELSTYPVPPEGVLPLVLGSEGRSASEYERLIAELARVLPRVPPQKLTEADIDLLVKETSRDRQQIVWLSESAKCAQVVTGVVASEKGTRPLGGLTPAATIPAEAFYAWFRNNQPVEFDALVAVPESILKEGLEAGLRDNIVPARLRRSIHTILTAWAKFKAARTLRPAPVGAAVSLGDVLNTLPKKERLSPVQQVVFANLRQAHGDGEALWAAAKHLPALARAVPGLRRTFALAELTQEHPALMTALQETRRATQPDSLEYLAAFEPRDWIGLVFEHGVPPDSGLDRDGYIETLQSDVEGKFPAQVLRKQLEKTSSESDGFPRGKVLKFLKANPDFDLRTQPVEPYLKDAGNRDKSLREGLLQLQRIHALTANARETRVLHDAGFESSAQIISEGKPAFDRKVAGELSPEQTARIFTAADNVVTTVVAIGTAYASPATSGNAIEVIPPPLASEDTLGKYPSLRSLFGDLDYCQCRHCQSVLGPAAYLADLLHFLQRSPLKANPDGRLSVANIGHYLNPYLEYAVGGTVLGVLHQRRPDLADLELSCENTETEIPYIDLVLEVLENAVALPMAVVVEGIDINAQFERGKVPSKVAEALHKTAIEVGEDLHVTADLHLGANSPLRNWIITDGSRRWLVQHRKQQFLFFTQRAGNIPIAGALQSADVARAVESLKRRKLNAKLAAALAQPPLSIERAQIQEISIGEIQANAELSAVLRGWTVKYTRSIAVKITKGNPVGAVELLKTDGTQFSPRRQWQWPSAVVQVIISAFAPGTSKINPNVAQLLGLPADETYVQTWNATRKWWELRVQSTALFLQILEGLNVSGLTYQNSSIRDRLESSPENRNPAAYEKLSRKGTVFPWALPFDLWLEETRAFLEALGIPRARLIDLSRPQSRLSEEAAALELLGLSKSEADLIASAAASNKPWIYWGLEQRNNKILDQTAGAERIGGWLEVLANVSMLLQQSGLGYREYLDFLQTRFAGQPIPTLFPPNECKTSKIVLQGVSSTQLTKHLNRVHVFTRLWRKSGWSMRELDLVLEAFGGQLTATILPDLALVKRLRAALELPVSVLVGCVDNLEIQAWTDHTKDGTPLKPALYDSVYQRASLRSLAGFKDFALEKLGHPLLSISDRADFVAASLGVKPDEVRAWISGTPNLGIADSVNLDSLSRLHAAATLCRAVQIAPNALPDIVALLGRAADPFRTLPSSTTRAAQAQARARAILEFVERIEFVRKSGFDLETLSYLLRHTELPHEGGAVGTEIEQQLIETLTELRSALQSGVVLGDVSTDNVKRQLARLDWYPVLIETAVGADGLNYRPGASVEINSLHRNPEIPLDLRSQFRYREVDATKAVLECSGSLDEFAFKRIKNLHVFPAGSVTDLKTEYEDQLAIRVKALASLLQIMELESLPKVKKAMTGLTAVPVIPGELKDRLKFEFDLNSATTGTLILTGWLSDTEKEALQSGTDPLKVVIIALHAKSLHAIPAPSSLTLQYAEQLLRGPDGETRNRSILLRLVPRLELDLLIAQLSGALGADPQVVRTLLDAAKVNGRSAKLLLMDSEFLGSYAKTTERTTAPDQFAVLELLGKIAAIANRLTITPDQLDWALGKAFTVMNVLALPTSAVTAAPAVATFDGWRKLVDLFRLRDVLPDGAKCVAQVYEALTDATSTAAQRKSKVLKILAEAFESDQQQADTACGAELLNFKSASTGANDHSDPSRLLELAQLLQVRKLLGTPCSDIARLIQSAQTESEAQLARALFAASIRADVFPERLRPISNRLRNLQRDALVAYMVHHDHLADSSDLFDRYLIDVEMGSCMLTSRIKQAISSTQLFVQRCLLNLERPARPGEPGVCPISIDAQRWEWMKHYRVWEANRKIFLYPENFIEPGLRDDKTELFQAFESDLLQSELTHDTALAALRKYLDHMADIVNLTVVGMFEEVVEATGQRIVHLVGRDNSQPYKHYYRQWKRLPTQDFGTWTAWEEISAQVDSEHVLVFVFGESVHLAWPTISAINLKWNISMNIAKRTSSGWTKLKKGRGEIENPMVPDPTRDERNGLGFQIRYNADKTVSIRGYGSSGEDAGLEPIKTDGPRGKFDGSRPYRQENAADTPFGNIYLDFDLRALASYLYEYPNNLAKVHYQLGADLDIKVGIKALVLNTVDNTTVEIGYNDDRPKNRVVYRGSVRQIFGIPKAITLIAVSEITVEVRVPTTGYADPAVFRVFSVSGVNVVTWKEDFLFELSADPRRPVQKNLVHAGSFLLKDDDSLELDSREVTGIELLPIHQDTESFTSGYREVGGTGALAVLPTTQTLNPTPAQYFIAPTIADQANAYGRHTYAYCDDRFSLLFWKNRETDVKYRVVPFSTGGMTKLKSAITRGRLLDAVALPAALAAAPIGVVGFAADTSVTEVKIDFGPVPPAIYNWEVFFHNPLLVATQLSQAQRFEEAQRWFHLIFDPTTNDAEPDPAIRYWRFLPFREAGAGDAIDKLLQDLAKGTPQPGLKDQIEEWAENPFRPHLVARHRLRSYQFAVVQKYLENLIAWGDQLFRRDTIESINEATQLYVLAARILGKRPVSAPKQGAKPKSYRDIESKLDDFSNAWISLEGPIATALFSSASSSPQYQERITGILRSLGDLYFCVPGNEKLSSYWDTVEDRLFKIRHCMNIEGIERQLPLFEPPIDPALLVRATAAGLDLASVLSDVQAPLPLYRFNVMVQKALELCSEVRTLGNAFLGALEKKDAEELSLLRSSHEIQMLKLVRAIKEQQQREAVANLEALRKTRELTVLRYLNFQRLLGKQNVVVPGEGAAAALESSTLQLAPPEAGVDAQGLALIAAESGQLGWLNDANNYTIAAGIFNTLAGVAHALPEVTVSYLFLSATLGGQHLGNSLNAAGTVLSTLASNASFQSTQNAVIGGHQRRYDEWRFQSNTAAKELEQIDKQIVANEIRKEIAEREITNHEQQIENAQEVDELMRDKFTSQQLYSWMVGQISNVYFRTYQLAHDLAKRAERTYRFELGLKDSESNFVEFGYWDSLKKGLLSGERLYLDLKRMEVAYLEQNKREYEITKHISLLQLDPLAVLLLKETGTCEVNIPEALLDMDFPGHYLRRIKSVSLTIACVTGPYSSVPCTLTLLKHSMRHNSSASGSYARDIENDDPRFVDSFGALQSMVTSSAQNDSGLFETNLRDERYLPCEGVGVISLWRLELPKQFRPFDYDTISDVVLHLRYTARDGGGLLEQKAAGELTDAVNELAQLGEQQGLARSFSLRHEFPSDWYRFLNPPADLIGHQTLKMSIDKTRFPFMFQSKLITLAGVKLFVKIKPEFAASYTKEKLKVSVQPGTTASTTALVLSVSNGLLRGDRISGGAPGDWTLAAWWQNSAKAAHKRIDPQAIEDIVAVCPYTIG